MNPKVWSNGRTSCYPLSLSGYRVTPWCLGDPQLSIDRDSSSWGNGPDVGNSRGERNSSSTGAFPEREDHLEHRDLMDGRPSHF